MDLENISEKGEICMGKEIRRCTYAGNNRYTIRNQRTRQTDKEGRRGRNIFDYNIQQSYIVGRNTNLFKML